MRRFFDAESYQQTGLRIRSPDLQETEAAYHIALLAPGLKPRDIVVTTKERMLTITNAGQHAFGPKFSFDKFSRTITTLHAFDESNVHVVYKSDVINVTLLKLCRDLPLTKSASHPFATDRPE